MPFIETHIDLQNKKKVGLFQNEANYVQRNRLVTYNVTRYFHDVPEANRISRRGNKEPIQRSKLRSLADLANTVADYDVHGLLVLCLTGVRILIQYYQLP